MIHCGLSCRYNEFCEDCISMCLTLSTYINERVKDTLEFGASYFNSVTFYLLRIKLKTVHKRVEDQ